MIYGQQAPLKMFLKIPPPKKKKSTTRPSILYAVAEIDEIEVFYNQQINKGTPHFTFMRRAQNADASALKQHQLPQNGFPVCFSFVLIIASDFHLEPQSEKGAENVDFHTAKNVQKEKTLFRYF